MKYTIEIRPTCGKEGVCKVADKCKQLTAQDVGTVIPLASEDPDRLNELQRAGNAKLQGRKLLPCTVAENPQNGGRIPLTWLSPNFIPVYK